MPAVPTPNQAARREELVKAAVEVLRIEGVAACTARAIADASPLTKSALHYYFDDVAAIVDLAFARLMDQFFDRVDKAAADATDPVDALWAAAATYLRLGADRPDGHRVPMLWFDYHVWAMRRGDVATAARITERTAELFAQLVEATGVSDPGPKADALFSALIGTVVRHSLDHRPAEAVLDQLAVAAGLPRR